MGEMEKKKKGGEKEEAFSQAWPFHCCDCYDPHFSFETDQLAPTGRYGIVMCFHNPEENLYNFLTLPNWELKKNQSKEKRQLTAHNFFKSALVGLLI